MITTRPAWTVHGYPAEPTPAVDEAALRVRRSQARCCWRCGIDFAGHDHLPANAPCGDCRLVLRTLEGETTRWRGTAFADVERTFDPTRALVAEEVAA
ncbi:hypothetical protein EDF35_1903 [Rathayibacter sp. PhB151]|uniref:hypothetical protein n=1 Tax=Rathayibacter sp. PhB151 TaxID=2485189 RepID=UPI0010629C3B|nr:hypothetical protein [Rathayibacter sp. PhB151]TDX78689.1 hypothetical protein EDF35_1903 [Rathayibacter sp. PhB151]